MNNKLLNFKYALVNVFYFMLGCGALGYANNFLKFHGYPSSLIGIVLSLISVLALVGQTFMAPVIDRSTKINEKKFILITLLIGMISYLVMLMMHGENWFLLLICVVGFSFTSMGLPFLNSLAFAYEQEGGRINYGVSRGIGSAAYAVAGPVIGMMMTAAGGGDEKITEVLPVFLLITGALTMATVFWMKDPKKVVKEDEKTKSISYPAFFRKYHQITLVLAALVLIYFCHMLVNTYMINVLENIGGNTADQGNAIFIQAMCELPPMFLFALILKKVDVDKLMAFGALAYIVKHALLCFAPNMAVFYIAMVLQMFSYAVIMPASVYFADKHVEAEDRNKGQIAMTAASTVGSLLANLVGGFLLDFTSVSAVLTFGFIATVIGAVLMVIGIRNLSKKA